MIKNNPIKLALADDHTAMRSALASFLDGMQEFEVLFEASTTEELETKLKWKVQPEVLLLDYSFGTDDSTSCIRRIRQMYGESISIIGLSMFKDNYTVSKMIDAGANGYLFKGVDTIEIVEAVKDVYKNGFTINKLTSSLVFGQSNANGKMGQAKILNEVERNIIKHICKQETNEQIADELNLAINTINTYRKKILKKIECKNTAGLVVYAIRNGIYQV